MEIPKDLKYRIYFLFLGFFLGILFHRYILMPFFNFEATEAIEEVPAAQEITTTTLEVGKDKEVKVEGGCGMYIDVSGSVKNPGVYCIEDNSLMVDAVNKAGGFTKDSATRFIARTVNLALPLSANQKIYFPFEQEVLCTLQEISKTYSYDDQTDTSSQDSPDNATNGTGETQCVNINSASKTELETLSGIGEATATKIIAGRPYEKIEDLLNVSGIGEASLNKIREDICL